MSITLCGEVHLGKYTTEETVMLALLYSCLKGSGSDDITGTRVLSSLCHREHNVMQHTGKVMWTCLDVLMQLFCGVTA